MCWLGLALATGWSTSCSSSDDFIVLQAASEQGRLELGLTGVSNAGVSYRLMGLFTITSVDNAFTRQLSTEDDPDATSISLDVPAGAYNVQLSPGYQVRRVTPVQPGKDHETVNLVNAVLISANPQRVVVSSGESELAVFRFRIGEDDFDTGPGRVTVVAEFDEAKAPPPACEADTPARLLVQWTDVPLFGGGAGRFTFQAALFASGEFAFVYDKSTLGDSTATVGFQGPSGQLSLELPPERFLTDASAYFVPDPDGTPALAPEREQPFSDIRATGTALTLGDDDGVLLDLPFSFPFLGATYGDVAITSNGVIGLSPPFPAYANAPLPDPSLGAVLAPFWDDLVPPAGGSVHYQLVGACSEDCSGTLGGLATLDGCGICSGGTTGVVPNATMDCAGVCGGSALPDACGVCDGDNTDPDDCPFGPDMIVDGQLLRETIREDVVDASTDMCLINEQCVSGPGLRRVIRFATQIANIGNRDLVVGTPLENNPLWEFDQCHEHFHFEHYAAYDLIDLATSEALPIGAKNGFCVLDLATWDPALAVNGCGTYDCGYQGISAGCADIYSADLPCQWIDVTDVAPGQYEIRVTTNPEGTIDELSYDNNSASVRIELTATGVSVLP
jgi:hypothetical protein